jgi:serine/threonine-protein kinase
VEPEIGDRVDGKYTLRRLIARGGMGLVFEARHAYTGRIVAVKLLVDDEPGYESMRARLAREALALAHVWHPNVVEVLDAGESDAHGPYLVMELLEGRPLDGILAARGPLDVLDVVHLGRQVCDAVACAHEHVVLHRDVKPSNVLVARDALGRELAKLIDFGVAGGESLVGPGDVKMTQKNDVVGTASYMAPEQLMGRPVDARADVYGIAATLFEGIGGVAPFTGTFPEILVKVDASEHPPSLAGLRPDAPEALCEVIERGLAKDPAQRVPGARAFALEMTRALGLTDEFGMHPSKGPERRLSLLAGVAAAPLRTNADPTTQRRRFPRGPYVTAVLIIGPDGTPLEGRTEDVSEGGILVNVAGTCAPGDRVRVRFALPRSDKMIAVDGVVRWSRPAHGMTLLGIEFVDLSPDARALIAATVEAWQALPA